jgi:small GTP-binding protein
MKKSNEMQSCKVTLIGDSGVGKTAIIGRYISGFFQDINMTSTNASYSKKIHEYKGKKVRMDIWDTVGQEKYRSLGINFYKNSYIIILIYDITTKETFENIKNIWYPQVKQYGEQYHILALVGNKADKFELEAVKDEEAKEFADEIGAQYFQVSAKSGAGINYMFEILGNLFLDPEFSDKIKDQEECKRGSIVLNRIEKKKGCSCNK